MLTRHQMIEYAQQRAAETEQYSWRALQFDLHEWPDEFGRLLMATILRMEEYGVKHWIGVPNK
jgi:hypothetical protein